MSHQTNIRRLVPGLLVLLIVTATLRIASTWRLESVAGQTIPWPTRTPTSTPPGFATSTPTWTPRPTWTRVPTAEQPTAGPLPQVATATATATILVLPSPTVVLVPRESPTLMAQPSPTLAATPTPASTATVLQPHPLAFEVVVMPQVAGPGDVVTFVVQVANVGYEPLEGVRVEVTHPDLLKMESFDCALCTVEPLLGGVNYLVGDLNPGQQVIFSVMARVANDAWPDQLVETQWTLKSPLQKPEVRTVELSLPWAPLPATGSSQGRE